MEGPCPALCTEDNNMSLTYFAEGAGLLIMLGAFAAIIASAVILVSRSKKRSMAGTIGLSIGFIALGAFVLVLSENLSHSAFIGNEAAMIPRLWAGILIPIGLLLIYRAVTGHEEEPEEGGRLDKVVAVAAVLVVMVFLMKYLGYFICSAIFVFACMYILDYRRYLTMTALSLAWVAFSYLLFYRLLWVTLPIGTVIKAIFKI